jgi:RNA polymerase sigma factor (TIGR02999 family)
MTSITSAQSWTPFSLAIHFGEMEERTAPLSETAPAETDRQSMPPERYETLRRLAASYLRNERVGHTLQPTALVHEAFIRLLEQTEVPWSNEEHFVALAARAMRRILINYGIARTRQKRGGHDAIRLPLDEALDFCAERNLNIVAVDEVLEELRLVDERQARIVELRFFAGLSTEEIASALGISPATVKREWATAKMWLHAKLSGRA